LAFKPRAKKPRGRGFNSVWEILKARINPFGPTKKKIMAKEEEDLILEHDFVPKHELITEKEVEEVLNKYGIKNTQLPKISKNDPAIASMKLNRGDIIRITRKSETADKPLYYRIVI